MKASDVASLVLAAVATAATSRPGTDAEAQARQDAKDIKKKLSLDKETGDSCESILLTVAATPARELVSVLPPEAEAEPEEAPTKKKATAKKK
jgi:hypothetical protein